MRCHDPQEREDKIDGLVQRYRDGVFSTVVFTASLKALHLRGNEIADLVCQHIFVHQASLPYRRGTFGFEPIGDAAMRVVERIRP